MGHRHSWKFVHQLENYCTVHNILSNGRPSPKVGPLRTDINGTIIISQKKVTKFQLTYFRLLRKIISQYKVTKLSLQWKRKLYIYPFTFSFFHLIISTDRVNYKRKKIKLTLSFQFSTSLPNIHGGKKIFCIGLITRQKRSNFSSSRFFFFKFKFQKRQHRPSGYLFFVVVNLI